MYKIAYLGNFKFPWCSEVHAATTLEQLGNEVVRLQEDETPIDKIVEVANDCDFFLWTRTYGMLKGDGFEMLKRIKVLTVSWHLDYYFGISRQTQMSSDPFWFTDVVFQPDGDHQDDFKKMNINAYWLPPGVFKDGCYLEDRPKTHDLIFVGSWSEYHGEWPWRRDMINKLSTAYPQFEKYPQGEAVREKALNELYASTKVVVGDSIMADKSDFYTTDRIFETTGRGGFIIYPDIKWVTEQFDGNLVTYEPNNWDDLRNKINYYLTHDDEREASRKACHEITKKHHTYHQRFEHILKVVADELKLR